jgi:endoglucanase
VKKHPHRWSARSRLAAVIGVTLVATGLSATAAQADASEQIKNGTFDAGTAPWWWTGNLTPAATTGQLCADVPAGSTNPWDAIIGQNDITLQSGQSYTLSFTASATRTVGVLANVQLQDSPYTQQISQPTALSGTPQSFSYSFTSNTDSSHIQVAFQIGGSASAWTLCVDNVSLKGGAPPPVYTPDPGPRVKINQVGYLIDGPKQATLVTNATDPVGWQLKDSSGAVVDSGTSTPRGTDAASGQSVQDIDFSPYRTVGTGYTLIADGATSYPFAIGGNLYDQLRSDALHFFYVQRSGIAIDDALAPGYGRPAGHVGVAPNQGDTSVPCVPGVCDYTRNVVGGWYDAGDHGKYVVNGGIATYQLLGEFERTKNTVSVHPGALGDSTLRVPETGNGVPDVLDEARWELRFLLEMQVPAGQPYAGMAFHKIHDQNWTGLPLAPQSDPQPRQLHAPSTAATLNLAATAAQCARLFAPYDRAFAQQCLTAAQAAWQAGLANPAMYASPSDGNGGGTYGDGDVTDEFYWAAAQLYISTGEQQYLTYLKSSPHWSDGVFAPGGFSWGSTAALGRLDLATVPNLLPAADLAAVRASVLTAADDYLGILAGQAYGLPLPADQYVWGSTSQVLNNLVVLANAYDLTGLRKYRDGAAQGMDYILGRNALSQSFVTGYGTRFSQNQHTRIYAHQLDPNLPHPPAGSIAGGPNATPADPLAQKDLAGCAPQFCYIDDIQSYSTNEVAINWNSALSWMASFLADQGGGAPAKAGSCHVDYDTKAAWPGGFITTVTVRNTGTTAVDGWALGWSFTGAQAIGTAWNASTSQTGATVAAKNLGHNARIRPGRSVTFGFIGTTSGANPPPHLFTLNGAPCA